VTATGAPDVEFTKRPSNAANGFIPDQSAMAGGFEDDIPF